MTTPARPPFAICLGCGRKLTGSVSMKDRYGPICGGRMQSTAGRVRPAPKIHGQASLFADAPKEPKGVEDQKSISDWAVATFGASSGPLRIAARAHSEMTELLQAIAADDFDAADPAKALPAAEEAADVAIVLYRLIQKISGEIGRRWMEAEPDGSAAVNAAAANIALAEVVKALCEVPQDLDRVVYCCRIAMKRLALLALALGTTLQVQVDEKMKVNRARKWRSDTSQHIEERA